MSSRSLFEARVPKPFQRSKGSWIMKTDLGIEGNAYIHRIKHLGGIRPNAIQLVHDTVAASSSNFSDWSASSANIAITTAKGPTKSAGAATGALKVTVTTGASATNNTVTTTLNSSANKDWRQFKYVGFWCHLGNSDTVAASALTFDLYGNSNTTYAHSNPDYSYTVVVPAITEAATAAWRYVVLDISGASEALLRNVTGIGFRYTTTCTDADEFHFSRIELFTHAVVDATSAANASSYSSPVRGLIMEAFAAPAGTAITAGLNLVFDSEGNVKVATADTDGPFFAGVALDAVDVSSTYVTQSSVRFVVDGIINRKVSSAIAQGIAHANPAMKINNSTTVVALGNSIGNAWKTIGVLLYNGADTGGVIANSVAPMMIRKSGYAGYADA